MTSVYLENTSSVQGTSPSPQVTLNGSYVLGNGCVVLKVTAFTPWDSPDNLVSAATERLVDRVKAAVVVPLCFFIGGAGNCLNMAVFLKQGLRERINMCLFTLALLDFVYLSFAFFIYGERITALFKSLPRSVYYLYCLYLTFYWKAHPQKRLDYTVDISQRQKKNTEWKLCYLRMLYIQIQRRLW